MGLTPVSQDQMYLFLLEHVPENPWRDPKTQHLILRKLLADYGGPMVQIRAELGPESEIVYRPLESHYLGNVWHRDRLILIGDAAHATTPQPLARAWESKTAWCSAKNWADRRHCARPCRLSCEGATTAAAWW